MQHLILKIKPEQLSDIIQLVDHEQKLDAIHYIADQTPLNELQALRVIDAITHERDHVLKIQHEQTHSIPDGIEAFQSPTISIESNSTEIPPIHTSYQPSDLINQRIEKTQTKNNTNLMVIGAIGIVLLMLLIWKLS